MIYGEQDLKGARPWASGHDAAFLARGWSSSEIKGRGGWGEGGFVFVGLSGLIGSDLFVCVDCLDVGCLIC